jgi:hypothetical protein
MMRIAPRRGGVGSLIGFRHWRIMRSSEKRIRPHRMIFAFLFLLLAFATPASSCR